MRPLNRLSAVLAFLAMMLAAPAILAAPAPAAATVEAVQSPAWRDRGGMTTPLAAGMELKSGDIVRTGAGARAYLMLAEGSRVKLGEAARFTLFSRSLQPDKYFRGALDVLAGAFRFTTGKFAKTRPREVAIRVGTATIGTDHMDIPYLESRGIQWCFAPGCNANSVAEYVTSALLCLAQRHGFTLEGKTIGIVGIGNVM
jgi:hypothetical protein